MKEAHFSHLCPWLCSFRHYQVPTSGSKPNLTTTKSRLKKRAGPSLWSTVLPFGSSFSSPQQINKETVSLKTLTHSSLTRKQEAPLVKLNQLKHYLTPDAENKSKLKFFHLRSHDLQKAELRSWHHQTTNSEPLCHIAAPQNSFISYEQALW